MAPRYSVIIPACNEGELIADLVREIHRLYEDYEILVIDDGSTDDTANEAKEAGAIVFSHPYNIGNGAAIKTGVKKATGDILIMMDADRQHSPLDIQKLVSEMDRYTLVVGARSIRAKVSRIRTLGNLVFNKYASYIADRNIPDLTSGFRAVYREQMMEILHLLPNGFSYPSTSTLALIKIGYPVGFISLDTVVDRQGGVSKISPFKDGIRFISIIIRMGLLFAPFKLFGPVSILLGVVGVLYTIYQLNTKQTVTNMPMLLLITSLLLFFFGMIADQLAHIRRELTINSQRTEK